MSFFKNCCGCAGESYNTEEKYAYEPARAAAPLQHSPELQRYTLSKEHTVHLQEDAISVCPTAKALCEGQVHSLLEPNAFNPPLCSTKLSDEARHAEHRAAKSTSDLSRSFHTGGTLSDSFWSDIHRWGKKESRVQRRSTIHGISAETSSDFDSIVFPNQFKSSSKKPIEIEYTSEALAEKPEAKKVQVITESMLSKSVESNLYDATDEEEEEEEKDREDGKSAPLACEEAKEVEPTNHVSNKSVRFTVEPVRSEFTEVSLEESEPECGLSFEAGGRVSFKRL